PSAGGAHGARAAGADGCARAAVRARVAPDHALRRWAVMTLRGDAGRLGSRLRAVLLAIAVLAGAVAVPVIAQASAQVPVLDGIAAHYRDAARLWRPRLLPIAQQLFMVLASLEFAVSGA